jgi:hypothetical protein
MTNTPAATIIARLLTTVRLCGARLPRRVSVLERFGPFEEQRNGRRRRDRAVLIEIPRLPRSWRGARGLGDVDSAVRHYFAYSTARVSRMTVTLIWPGY